MWAWLRRPVPPNQLGTHTPTPSAENHYTVEETYTSVGNGEEALYAELDRRDDPAYQNTAYHGSDADPDPDASSPSSAYYSDLSTERCEVTRALGFESDRTYESVDHWETNPIDLEQSNAVSSIVMRKHQQPLHHLGAIRKPPPITVPSDYV